MVPWDEEVIFFLAFFFVVDVFIMQCSFPLEVKGKIYESSFLNAYLNTFSESLFSYYKQLLFAITNESLNYSLMGGVPQYCTIML